MRLLTLTTGTGTFYCGSCMRDAALARSLRQRGHDSLLAPLYLPMVLDERAEAEPLHMGGINVFLAHKGVRLPRFVQDWLDAPGLLRWAARRGDMTQADALGELTVAMLRGEEGGQRREIEKLRGWLATLGKPDVVLLSNALLLGLVGALKETLGCPVLCTLQGEAPFLDALSEPHRAEAWRLVAERARDVTAFLPVSAYTSELMGERLGLDPRVLHVVHNGIDPRELTPPARRDGPPTIGYVARLFRDKGLETLVEAFLLLKRRPEFGALRLEAVGTALRPDHAFLAELERRVAAAGHAGSFRFQANVSLKEKGAALARMTLFSVPATYGESFGLYLLEAWAMGLAVVQPAHAAFPELLAKSGGGLLCAPDDPAALAEGLATLLRDPARAAALGAAGRASVLSYFNAERMARDVERVAILSTRAPLASATRG